MKKSFFMFFIAIASISCFAAPICSFNTGITAGFDTILNTYATIAMKWSVIILPKAMILFWILFSMEFLYQLVFKKIITYDIQKLYVFFVVRIFTAYMFAHIFLNIDFYIGIITYFTKLGGNLGGVSISLSNAGAAGIGISPSSIMNYLECQYAIPTAALATGSFSPIGGQLFALLLFSILVLILSIPIALMLVMVDAYVVIFGGFILCGFSGSSWTQNYWQRYMSYVGGVAIRLFVTCLILGIVIHSFDALNNMSIPTITNPFTGKPTSIPNPAGIATYLEAMFGLLFFNVLTMITIPTKAAGMLSGTISGGLGEVIGGASMLMSGMRGVSGVSGATKVLASSVMGAPSVGKTAAIGKAREILGGGANGGASPSTNWKTSAKDAGADASKQSIKDGWKSAVGMMHGGGSGVNGQKGGAMGAIGASAQEAGKLSGGGHGGSADVNVNPHKD